MTHPQTRPNQHRARAETLRRSEGHKLTTAATTITIDRLLAYYRLADVCLVTPLRDGMNLVAKEYVTVQGAAGSAGALVLSEFTGAAEELTGAITCNPWDVDGLAAAIAQALDLQEDDRRARIADMASSVHEHDVFWWVSQELGALESPEPGIATRR